MVTAKSAPSPTELLTLLENALTPESWALLRARVGLGEPVRRFDELVHAERSTAKRMEIELRNIQQQLWSAAGDALRALRADANRLLDEHGGYLRADDVPRRGWVASAAGDPGDRDAVQAFRLLAFCAPGRFHVWGRALTRISNRELRRARPHVRSLLRPALLPMSMGELSQHLAAGGQPVEPGVLRRIVRRQRGLRLILSSSGDEVATLPPDVMSERLHEALEASSVPMDLDALRAEMRRHPGPRPREHRVVARLRRDPRLVQVGPSLWWTRRACAADLEDLRPIAREAAAALRANGRCHIGDLWPSHGPRAASLQLYLLAELLRRDPALRDLGRGEFCARHDGLPPWIGSVERSLRRAMGELPTFRFIDNQPERRRGQLSRLLLHNHLFVFPAADRVDLLSNYPFNQRRIAELLRCVDRVLDRRDGHTDLGSLLDAVRSVALGGEFLTAFLLGDLLRRHGDYELLPGDLVAARGRRLSAWIRNTAMQTLRDADKALTVDELVDAEPTLLPFHSCLTTLLFELPGVVREHDRLRAV